MISRRSESPPSLLVPRLQRCLLKEGSVQHVRSRWLTRVSLATVAYRSAGTAKHDGIQWVDFTKLFPLGGAYSPYTSDDVYTSDTRILKVTNSTITLKLDE